MDIKVKLIKRIVRVEFPDKEHIDRSRLSALLGVSRSAVTQWLKTGVVDERHVDRLREISIEDVWTDRKPYRKPAKQHKEHGHQDQAAG